MKPFDGDIDEHQAKLLKERGARAWPSATDVRPTQAPEEQRKAAADNRAQKAPLRRRSTARKMLARLTAQAQYGVVAKLSDPAIYSGPEYSHHRSAAAREGRLERGSPMPSSAGWRRRKPSKAAWLSR